MYLCLEVVKWLSDAKKNNDNHPSFLSGLNEQKCRNGLDESIHYTGPIKRRKMTIHSWERGKKLKITWLIQEGADGNSDKL